MHEHLVPQMREAAQRLRIIIPLTLLIIGFLVYSAVGTLRDTLLVLLSIPAACAGGIFALLMTRTNLSISAAMGFISISGSLEDAIRSSRISSVCGRASATGSTRRRRRPRKGGSARGLRDGRRQRRRRAIGKLR